MVPNLTKSDLEQRRTQAELRDWVDNLHRRFGQTNEGTRAIRLKKNRLVKKFMEEIWPLALFADAFYLGRSDILFQPAIGNQPTYDARIIESSTNGALHYLEITQAFDGYQNHLRMEHIEKYRRAPNTGPKLKRDAASGAVQETWPETERHEDLLKRTFAEIHKAVVRKSAKRYETNTSLIVEFEDRYIRSESDRNVINDFARSTLVPMAAGFADLYLVSDRERLAFKYGFAP